MAHLILGEHPDGLTVRLVHGDGMTLAATLTDDAGAEIDWPAAPSLEFAGPEQDTIATHFATINGPVASWNLTRAQVDTIWTASATRFAGPSTYVRALLPDGDNGSVEYAGKVAWSDGWTAGTQLQVKAFTRPIPVPGSGGGGSDSLTVVNGGTVTLDDTKAEGSLVGYRVKASTDFTAAAGSATLEPGAYTFERTDDGWTYYSATGTTLVAAPVDPAPGWTVFDSFAAADGAVLNGRTTVKGSKTWLSDAGGRSKGGAASAATITANAVTNTNTGSISTWEGEIDLGAASAEVSVDYNISSGAAGASERRVYLWVGAAGSSDTDLISVQIRADGSLLAFKGDLSQVSLTGTTSGLATSGTFVVKIAGTALTITHPTGAATATVAPGSGWSGTGTRCGFGVRWASSSVDNFKAR